MDQPTSKGLPMAHHTASSRITLHLRFRRVRPLVGDILIVGARNAIEVRESGYPQRSHFHKELPLADVDMSKLSVFSIMTHSPLKGDTTYYSLPDISNVAWSYEQPIGEMKAIDGRLAFDAHEVKELVEWRPLSIQNGLLSRTFTAFYYSYYCL